MCGYNTKVISINRCELNFLVQGIAKPETTTMLLFGAGLIGVVGTARKRKKTQA